MSPAQLQRSDAAQRPSVTGSILPLRLERTAGQALWLALMFAVGLAIGICFHGDRSGRPGVGHPVLNEVPVQYATVAQPIGFAVRNTNRHYPDQTLRFRLAGVFPSNARLIPMTGRFAWTPGPEDYGRRYEFEIVADEPGRAQDVARSRVVIDWKGIDASSRLLPPVIAQDKPLQTQAGRPIATQVRATHSNLRPIALQYLLGADAPAGARIDARTGRFRWLPTAAFDRRRIQIPVRVVATAYWNGRIDDQVVSEAALSIQVGTPLEDPVVLPVESLRVAHGMGPIRVNSNLTVARWNVVTGLVPVGRQEAELRRALDVAPDQPLADDGLEYFGFSIERADVTPLPDGSRPALNWESLDTPAWRPRTLDLREVVAAEAVHPKLTNPLPPIEYLRWGEQVSHPRIAELVLEDHRRRAQRFRDRSADARGIGAVLFRYFDLNVQLERTYCYRVSLRMANPHYLRDPAVLVNPATTDAPELASRWSASSDPIVTTQPFQLLAVPFTPSSIIQDGAAHVILRGQQRGGLGRAIYKEFTVTRGTVANFPREVTTVPGPDGQLDVEADFLTNQQVVDFMGDTLLLLDDQGRLSTATDRVLPGAHPKPDPSEDLELLDPFSDPAR